MSWAASGNTRRGVSRRHHHRRQPRMGRQAVGAVDSPLPHPAGADQTVGQQQRVEPVAAERIDQGIPKHRLRPQPRQVVVALLRRRQRQGLPKSPFEPIQPGPVDDLLDTPVRRTRPEPREVGVHRRDQLVGGGRTLPRLQGADILQIDPGQHGIDEDRSLAAQQPQQPLHDGDSFTVPRLIPPHLPEHSDPERAQAGVRKLRFVGLPGKPLQRFAGGHVLRIPAGEAGQQSGQVERRARHDAETADGGRHAHGAGAAHQPARRDQPQHAAVGGRHQHRAAGIGAQTEGRVIRRQRGPGAAARPARHVVQVVRVEGLAAERAGAHRRLAEPVVGVDLGQHHRAGIVQPADRRRVAHRAGLRQRREPSGSRHAGDIDRVLDHHRNAVQRPPRPATAAFPVQLARPLQSLGIEVDHRIDARPAPVVRLDPVEAALHQPLRREPPLVERPTDRRQGGLRQREPVTGLPIHRRSVGHIHAPVYTRRRRGASPAAARTWFLHHPGHRAALAHRAHPRLRRTSHRRSRCRASGAYAIARDTDRLRRLSGAGRSHRQSCRPRRTAPYGPDGYQVLESRHHQQAARWAAPLLAPGLHAVAGPALIQRCAGDDLPDVLPGGHQPPQWVSHTPNSLSRSS